MELRSAGVYQPVLRRMYLDTHHLEDNEVHKNKISFAGVTFMSRNELKGNRIRLYGWCLCCL
jgi:hypothetical protein